MTERETPAKQCTSTFVRYKFSSINSKHCSKCIPSHSLNSTQVFSFIVLHIEFHLLYIWILVDLLGVDRNRDYSFNQSRFQFVLLCSFDVSQKQCSLIILL